MNNKQMNASESLDLITRMITDTRQNIERSAHRPFIVWGYATIIVTLTVWHLYRTTQSENCFFIWFAIPVLAGIGMIITGKKDNKHTGYVRTPIDRVLSHIWIVLSVVAFITTLSSFIKPLPILFIISILMGAGSTMTGLILQQKTISIAGFAGIVLSLLFLTVDGINQCLIFAVIFFVMMVLPGHILQYRQHKQRSNV